MCHKLSEIIKKETNNSINNYINNKKCHVITNTHYNVAIVSSRRDCRDCRVCHPRYKMTLTNFANGRRSGSYGTYYFEHTSRVCIMYTLRRKKYMCVGLVLMIKYATGYVVTH